LFDVFTLFLLWNDIDQDVEEADFGAVLSFQVLLLSVYSLERVFT
jgi:hypothetical protein